MKTLHQEQATVDEVVEEVEEEETTVEEAILALSAARVDTLPENVQMNLIILTGEITEKDSPTRDREGKMEDL